MKPSLGLARTMYFLRTFLFLVILVGLPACSNKPSFLISSDTPRASVEPTPIVTPSVTIMRTPIPIIGSTPDPLPSSTPVQTLFPTVTKTLAPPFDQPNQLYMLVEEDYGMGGMLWILNPDAHEAEQLSTANEAITCFDLSPVDSKLAYGTFNGRVYVQVSGEEPKMVVDSSLDAPYSTSITGLSWSPDGTQLAYTVAFQNFYDAFEKSKYPMIPSGVWVLNLNNPQPIWLLSNSYLESEQDNVVDVSRYRDPFWAPDGKALAVHEERWEDAGIVWFYPIRPVLMKSEAHYTNYTNFSWSINGDGLLLGGMHYTDIVNLTWLSRDGGKMRVLVDGTKGNIEIYQPFTLRTGIAFTAFRDGNENAPILFYGKIDGEIFEWSELDINPLCGENISSLFSNHSEDDILTLLCGKTDLRLIEPAANSFSQIDLSPFLNLLKGAVVEIHLGKKLDVATLERKDRVSFLSSPGLLL